MIIVVGMIMIEDGVTNIINTGMIIMAGMTDGGSRTIMDKEDGIEIRDLTTTTIDIIRRVPRTILTMIARTTADILGGRTSLVVNCE